MLFIRWWEGREGATPPLTAGGATASRKGAGGRSQPNLQGLMKPSILDPTPPGGTRLQNSNSCNPPFMPTLEISERVPPAAKEKLGSCFLRGRRHFLLRLLCALGPTPSLQDCVPPPVPPARFLVLLAKLKLATNAFGTNVGFCAHISFQKRKPLPSSGCTSLLSHPSVSAPQSLRQVCMFLKNEKPKLKILFFLLFY